MEFVTINLQWWLSRKLDFEWYRPIIVVNRHYWNFWHFFCRILNQLIQLWRNLVQLTYTKSCSEDYILVLPSGGNENLTATSYISEIVCFWLNLILQTYSTLMASANQCCQHAKAPIFCHAVSILKRVHNAVYEDVRCLLLSTNLFTFSTFISYVIHQRCMISISLLCYHCRYGQVLLLALC